jgi:hypothetical protein
VTRSWGRSDAPLAAGARRGDPHPSVRFRRQPETAADNAVQSSDPGRSPEQIARDAHAEVTTVAETLRDRGVTVHLFDDETAGLTPDSVFPNNWFSTHAGGHVAIYPMWSPNRRLERRGDVIDLLKNRYRRM